MSAYLLPTAEILRQVKQFDSVFSFYENGIKGVISNTVTMSAGYLFLDYLQNKKIGIKHPAFSPLKESILQQYSLSNEARLADYSCYPDNSLLIEVVVDLIEEAVNSMMYGIFMKEIYDVSIEQSKWFGSDLIAIIKIYRE
jgi:hypothetical protein